jgi:hypothetical protein
VHAYHVKAIDGEIEVTLPGGLTAYSIEDGDQVAISLFNSAPTVTGDVTIEAVSAVAHASFTVIGKTA